MATPSKVRVDRSGLRRVAHALLMIVLAAMPGWMAHAADTFSARQIEEIRRLGAAALSKDGLPGLSIAVAQGGRIFSAGFGHADLENGVQLDARALFRTASISKWLTATAAMRLVEAGKLDLDAPIQQYCPQYPQKQWTVTSRQVLNHLGGIRHYHGANGESRATEQERKTLEDLSKREQSTQFTRFTDVIKPLDAFKDDPLISQPGTRFLYTSLGYRVLGCVLEGAARVPYRTLMRELVFAPAGMSSITEDDVLAIIPRRVAGYARNANGTLTRAQFRDVSENLPAGGHLASAEDLVRFAAAFNSGKLVKAATRDQMMARPRLLDGSPVPYAPPFFGVGATAFYGMGVFVGSMKEEPLLAHTGSQSGASTELMLAPRSDAAVAVMSNVSGWNGAHALAVQIAEVVAE